MIELFFDTSYLCKLNWPEAGSEEVIACAARADVLVCGVHVRADFCSFSHRKVREAAATREQMAVVLKQFDADCRAGVVRLAPLTSEILVRVEEAYLRAAESVFLRAADALHLACAAENGFTEVYSNKRQFLGRPALRLARNRRHPDGKMSRHLGSCKNLMTGADLKTLRESE